MKAGVGFQIVSLACSTFAAPVSPATQLKRACVACHTLDVVRAQRLSREEWSVELDKMISMGAKVKDRAALLDYLARKYGPRR